MLKQSDILVIHSEITKHFEKKKEFLPQLYARLHEFKKIQFDISQQIKEVEDEINDIIEEKTYKYYLHEVGEIIKKYKEVIGRVQKVNFLNPNQNIDTSEKDTLEKKYKSIVSTYNFNFFHPHSIGANEISEIKCSNCGSNEFDDFDNSSICLACYTLSKKNNFKSSYRDSSRINISSKYLYDRKIHFRDCIKQFQAQQSCNIEPDVYTLLEREFEKNKLLNNSDSREIKYSRVTKNHIVMFLKIIKYTKHYENVHLIHHVITGQKSNDISHIENKLISDFDKLSNLYDQLFGDIERKSFINTQYVLFQLLQHNGYDCKKEDFLILKTLDKKQFHNNICQELFNKLNWNMVRID